MPVVLVPSSQLEALTEDAVMHNRPPALSTAQQLVADMYAEADVTTTAFTAVGDRMAAAGQGTSTSMHAPSNHMTDDPDPPVDSPQPRGPAPPTALDPGMALQK